MTRTLINADNATVIAKYVRSEFQANANFRNNNGDTARIMEAMQYRRGVYTPDQLARYGSMAPYLNIVGRKAFDFESLFSDLQFNVASKPWTFRPVVRPRMPNTIKRFIAVRLLNTFGPELLDSKSPETQYFIIREAQKLGFNMMETEANDVAGEVSKTVMRQMTEAGWPEHYQELINDIATYPSAITKGPYVEMERGGVWQGDRAAQGYAPRMKIRRVAPQDFYPSPDSTTTQNGANVCELLHLSPKWLWSAHSMEGFYRTALNELIEKLNGKSFSSHFEGDVQYWGDCVGDVYNNVVSNPHEQNQAFGIEMWGGESGAFLKKELNITRGIQDEEYYEFRFIVGMDKAVYGVLNPYPDHIRPYHSSSYRMYNDRFWGDAPKDLLKQIQDMILALTRGHQRNAAMQAEPIYLMDQSRFSRRSDANDIHPGARMMMKPDPLFQNTPPIRMEHIPSNTEALRSALLDFYRLSDDLVGIPSFVTNQPGSSVGRVGAVYVNAISNALKSIRKVGQNIDRGTVEPTVELMWKLLRDHSTEIPQHFDMEVEVSGIAGLVEKELMGNQDEFVLQTLGSVTRDLQLNPNIMLRFLNRYFEKLGLGSIPELPDPDQDDTLSALQGSITGVPLTVNPATQTTAPGSPQTQLDGRSPQLPTARTPNGP